MVDHLHGGGSVYWPHDSGGDVSSHATREAGALGRCSEVDFSPVGADGDSSIGTDIQAVFKIKAFRKNSFGPPLSIPALRYN